ncbi:DMT family transporter [Photobacterium carnosum]|uniref:DMT family transporter n=1 Tax=Photobacterium carnosum TaxID=2023717 RepID=UPI001E28BFB4|nr:DMT family transporter [Photobacterium carnosum]
MHMKKGYIEGLTSGFFWAINAILVGYVISNKIMPITLQSVAVIGFFIAFFHDLFSSLTVFFTRIYRRQKLHKFKLQKHYALIISGMLAGPLGFTSYIQAIKYLDVGIATSTVAIYPVVIAIISVLFFNKKLTKNVLFSVVITVIGCIGINVYSSTISNETNNIYIGLFFALICVFSWSFECIVIERYCSTTDLDSDTMFFIRQCSSALLYLVIIICFFDYNIIGYFFIDYKYLGLIFITSLFATISYLLWYNAIDKLGAPIGTVLNVTYSFWGVVLGAILFNQYFDMYVLFFLILIMTGVILAVMDKGLITDVEVKSAKGSCL